MTQGTSIDADVIHVRTRSRAIAAGVVWPVLAPLLFVATGKLVAPGGGPPSWLGWALLGIVASGIVGATVAYRRARRRARVEIGETSLVVTENGERREIAKRTIENAMLIDGDDQKQLLELSLLGGEVLLLDCGSSQAARDALAQLALAHERNVTRIRMSPRAQEMLTELAGGLVGGMVAGFAAGPVASFLGAFAPFLIVACVVPAMIYGARWFKRQLPEMRVGADGVAFRGANSRATRFVPHNRIDRVEIVRRNLPKNPDARVVELATTDGERHVLAVHFATQERLAEALKSRIEEAIVERRATGAPLPSFAEIERQGKPTTEWLAELRSVGREQADYRRAQLTSEELDSLLTSGASSIEHRLGAAVILAARGEPDAKQRIRIAAESSADPTVSRALLAVAEGEAEEEAVAQAIEASAAR